MNNSGHVRFHRKVRDNPLWRLSPAVFKLHSHCIMEALWKPGTGYDGVASFPIPVGSFQTTLRKLADDCFISVQQVRDGLAHLERLGIISTHIRTHRYTVVTVRKYKNYNPTQQQENTEENTQCVPEHTENTPRTHREHSLASPTRVNRGNSNDVIAFVDSNSAPLKEEESKKERMKVSQSVAPNARAPSDRLTYIELLVKQEGQRLRELAGPTLCAEIAEALGDAPVSYLQQKVQRGRRRLTSLGLLRNFATDARVVWRGESAEREREAAAKAAQEKRSAEEFDTLIANRRAVLADPHETAERKQWAREDLDMLLRGAG
jgi:hypothetical protein